MRFFQFLIAVIFFFILEKVQSQDFSNKIMSDQEKAIKAVNEGEILTLDQILKNL